MEELTLAVPDMWADHHVLAVRDALAQQAGVADVVASARDTSVRVVFDPSQTRPDQIAASLGEAGYPPGDREEAGPPPTNKPAWATAGVRKTTTDPIDLVMSGDHRKY
jgi:Cu2+-exporting ATPase